jgi:protein-disulfide isomerase
MSADHAPPRLGRFYILLAIIAAAGVGLLFYQMKQGAPKIIDLSNLPAAVGDSSTGYFVGNPDAKVKIIEFADFECPGCASYSLITGPDVRSKIIDAGLANLTFVDFQVIPQHENANKASMAAACANEQGKFWEMHDKLFARQDEWDSRATSKPKPFFRRYAEEIGNRVGSE